MGNDFIEDDGDLQLDIEQDMIGQDRVEDIAEQISDCTHLENLTIDHVCRSLLARFETHSLYYTWIGTLLLALNPCTAQPALYSDQVKQDFYNKPLDFSKPHIFAIAQDACCSLKTEPGNMTYTAVLSGESGSGKTETARLLLSYLTWHSRRARQVQVQQNDNEDRIERKLTQANTVLEAFGNAVTTRNHNSSRFGKLSRISYRQSEDEVLTIYGAEIVTYLLAKSRLAHLPCGEQIFHIFYTLCSGNKESAKREVSDKSKIFHPAKESFESSESLDSSNNNRRVLIPFDVFQRAAESCGFQKDQLQLIWDVLHAIILFKEIEFVENDDKSDISLDPSSLKAVNEIAVNLLGQSSSNELQAILTGVKVLDSRRPYRIKEAWKNRDAIMTHLYDRLFCWVVKYLNDGLQQRSQNNDAVVNEIEKTIQILDIYGFENVEHNGMEQLLINYANEKLQRIFFDHLVLNEIRLYEAEGLSINIANNGRGLAIENIEQVSTEIDQRISALNGIFKTLHDSSFAPISKEANRDRTFCESVNRRLLAENGTKRIADLGLHQFIYRHFAEPVVYNSEGFCEINNRQRLNKETSQYLHSAPKFQHFFEIANQLDDDINSASGNHSRSSLGLSFSTRVESLGNNLNQSNTLAFVRCIKPNSMDPSRCSVPVPCDKTEILKQMVHSGVPLVLNVMRFGYPCRINLHKLRIRLLSGMQKAPPTSQLLINLSDRDFITLVFSMFKVPSTDFHIGKSGIVFFKHNILGQVKSSIINNDTKLWEISEEKWINLYRATIMHQKLTRSFLTITFVSRLRRSYCHRRKSAISIQQFWRYHKFNRRLHCVRRLIVNLQAVCRGYLARKSTRAKKTSVSAVQRMWRNYKQRRSLHLFIQQIRDSGALNATPETIDGPSSSSSSSSISDQQLPETFSPSEMPLPALCQATGRDQQKIGNIRPSHPRAEALMEGDPNHGRSRRWNVARRPSCRYNAQNADRNQILIEEISKMKAGINHRKKMNRRMKRYGTLRSLSLAPAADMDHYLNGMPTLDSPNVRTDAAKRSTRKLAHRLRRDIAEPELLVIEDDIDSNLPLESRYNWRKG